ncbi:unnamed protein product [Boreogadus saida]
MSPRVVFSSPLHHVSERTVSQRVVCLGGVNSESSCSLQFTTAVERLSSHPALSRNSQGLPGAGLISVLKAEPGPGPDRYNQKIYGNVRLHCICSTTHHTN